MSLLPNESKKPAQSVLLASTASTCKTPSTGSEDIYQNGNFTLPGHSVSKAHIPAKQMERASTTAANSTAKVDVMEMLKRLMEEQALKKASTPDSNEFPKKTLSKEEEAQIITVKVKRRAKSPSTSVTPLSTKEDAVCPAAEKLDNSATKVDGASVFKEEASKVVSTTKEASKVASVIKEASTASARRSYKEPGSVKLKSQNLRLPEGGSPSSWFIYLTYVLKACLLIIVGFLIGYAIYYATKVVGRSREPNVSSSPFVFNNSENNSSITHNSSARST